MRTDAEIIASNLMADSVALPAPPAALAANDALTYWKTARTRCGVVRRHAADRSFRYKHTGSVKSWQVHGKTMLTGGPILNIGEAKRRRGKRLLSRRAAAGS